LLVASDLEALLLSEMIDDVPIVVCFSEDLVGAGLAQSLTQPGGNVTGIRTADYHARGLEILLEIDPTIEKVFLPYTSTRRESLAILESLQELADVLEIELVAAEIGDTEEDVIAMIRDIPEDIDGVYLPPERAIIQPEMFLLWLQTSVRLNAALAVPAAIPIPGVLMGYGPDTFVLGKQAAGMVDRILRGADPADTPVESAEYFLMVNLQTAENLGLTVPRSILRQAETIVRPGDLEDLEELEAETEEESAGDQ
jgi:putative ABC transport system substrate-binding protein